MSNKGANNEAIVAIRMVDHLLRYTLKGAEKRFVYKNTGRCVLAGDTNYYPNRNDCFLYELAVR